MSKYDLLQQRLQRLQRFKETCAPAIVIQTEIRLVNAAWVDYVNEISTEEQSVVQECSLQK